MTFAPDEITQNMDLTNQLHYMNRQIKNYIMQLFLLLRRIIIMTLGY